MAVAVMIDGALMPEQEARVSVFDRGFLYGDSVFEVLRTYGGVPFRERAHLERLVRSCERIFVRIPVGVDVLRDEIHRTLEAAGNAESYVRVVVTRGSGPVTYDPATAHDPVRIVMALPLAPPPPEAYECGIGAVTVTGAPPAAAGAKASNYLANLLALREARARGGEEAILLGPEGAVLEGASSNVFVVRGGAVTTPRTGAGILAGITRQVVLEAAREEGLEVREGLFFVRELYRADEVFITSSIREVVPVVSVDGVPVGAAVPGPVARRLRAAYRRAVDRQGAAS
jgi:branched-chain amino acid aminotransferase